MFKYAAIAVGSFTLFTVAMVVYALVGNNPKFDVAAAEVIFDRYPFWQESAVSSYEVVLDPKFSPVSVIQASVRSPAPAVVSPKALADWRAKVTPGVVLEFGLERLEMPPR
ncbi:MAG: hypothetical protein AAF337_07480 [Pseudomonadota bacterium]